MKYLGRRLLRAGLLLLGVSALCFLFTEMAPGSFFDEMRLNPQISPETIAALRSHYGLDQPLLVRYGRWMKSDLDNLRSAGSVGGQPARWSVGQDGQSSEFIPRFCSRTCDCGGAARDRSSLANPARRWNDVGGLRGPLRLGEIAGRHTPLGAAG